jgi:hypothetical protein
MAIRTNDEQASADLARRVEEAANEGVRKARERHAKNGIPMASWRDEKVVWLDPVTLEEVPAPPFARTTSDKK